MALRSAILVWCAAAFAALLVLLRIHLTGNLRFVFLLWNLTLAAVPLFFSTLATRASSPSLRIPLALLWLLFLPNAPSLWTDLVQLQPRTDIPVLFDVTMLFTCGVAASGFGLLSLRHMYEAVVTRLGTRIGAWMVAVTLVLCGFGLALGGVARSNSWDALVSPTTLLADIATTLDQGGITSLLIGATTVLFAGSYAFARACHFGACTARGGKPILAAGR